jgi:hypothetical protein
LDATGLIGDKSGLLLYGPIFSKDLKAITNISDNAICSNLVDPGAGSSYGGLWGTTTTDTSASGYRFYHSTSIPNTLYAYDLSKNLVFPTSANNVTSIKNIVSGKVWTESATKTTYTCKRYYNKRGIGNYNNNVELYS